MQVVATKQASIFWIAFTEQWDPKLPWHDRRLRLAVKSALDRRRINEAAVGRPPTQGFSLPGPLGLHLSQRNSPGILDGLYSAPDDPVHGLCCTRRPCRRAVVKSVKSMAIEPCFERIGFGAAAGRTSPWVP